MKIVRKLMAVATLVVAVACSKPAPPPPPVVVAKPVPVATKPPVPAVTAPPVTFLPTICKAGESKGVGSGAGRYSCIKCNENGTKWSAPAPCPMPPTKPPTPSPVCKEGDKTGAVGTGEGPVCMKCTGGMWVKDVGCK